jgi:hypothetical protein
MIIVKTTFRKKRLSLNQNKEELGIVIWHDSGYAIIGKECELKLMLTL